MHPPLPPLYYSELSFPGGARGCDKDRSFWINIRHQANSDVMWCGRRSSHRWFSCLEAKDPRYPPPHPDSALHHTLTNFPLILPNLNSCQTYKSHQPQPQPLTLIIEQKPQVRCRSWSCSFNLQSWLQFSTFFYSPSTSSENVERMETE